MFWTMIAAWMLSVMCIIAVDSSQYTLIYVTVVSVTFVAAIEAMIHDD
jgi:hypothetical protein